MKKTAAALAMGLVLTLGACSPQDAPKDEPTAAAVEEDPQVTALKSSVEPFLQATLDEDGATAWALQTPHCRNTLEEEYFVSVGEVYQAHGEKVEIEDLEIEFDGPKAIITSIKVKPEFLNNELELYGHWMLVDGEWQNNSCEVFEDGTTPGGEEYDVIPPEDLTKETVLTWIGAENGSVVVEGGKKCKVTDVLFEWEEMNELTEMGEVVVTNNDGTVGVVSEFGCMEGIEQLLQGL